LAHYTPSGCNGVVPIDGRHFNARMPSTDSLGRELDDLKSRARLCGRLSSEDHVLSPRLQR
jgi:hypothetical protein